MHAERLHAASTMWPETVTDLANGATTRSAWLLPAVPALVVRDGSESMRVVDLSTGAIFEAEGVLAAELSALLSGEPAGVALRALARTAPSGLVGRVVSGGAGERVPLTRKAALRLQGFDTLFVELTGRCNERCSHCYAGAGPQQTSALSRETCEQVLEDAARIGFTRVQFTGGDPLLCGFLPELVARTRALGFEVCEIFTNALLLDDALLDRLAPHRPRFAVSIYSFDPVVHDGITRVEGSHRATTDAVRRIVARGLRVRAAVVAMKENDGQLRRTMDFVRELGVDHASCSGSHRVGRGRYFDSGTEPIPDDLGGAHHGEVNEQRGTLCVASTGAVYPCIFNRTDVLGRVPQQRLIEIVEGPSAPKRRLESIESFLDQAARRLQCTNCRATALGLQLAET